ncbi:hypothetical protein CDG81_08335 [Actinopolyspora erythraea]|uniref:Uncharacterized protein n=1 Tax=Actinopolyspora erythraea TaxID=414996 RepID=A0A099D6E2_9ACTN|nr:hypothetical protein [Actinopolyspora erythraea]ASU78293.1 hypothetical protein CDG81_08335 [Actinopolyspora erythraea]KGI81738.1 hypothetical protein IL38_08360 [Actinopolyspora erythraea]
MAVALMFAFAGRYGYFGDELYFVAAGSHPDWGYADQRAIIPLLTVTMERLFPGSLVALRTPSILTYGVGRCWPRSWPASWKGDRRSRAFTTAAFVPAFASMFRNLNTIGLDILGRTLLTLLLLRWLRRSRWW